MVRFETTLGILYASSSPPSSCTSYLGVGNKERLKKCGRHLHNVRPEKPTNVRKYYTFNLKIFIFPQSKNEEPIKKY